MTCKELIQELEKMPPDNIVMIEDYGGYTYVSHVSLGVNNLDGIVFLDAEGSLLYFS